MLRHFAFLLSLIFTAPALADISVQNEHTRATLLASHDGVKAGGEITIGVLLEPQHGWHTYWENPGDAGIPTTLDVTVPAGVEKSGILWPVPEFLREQTLVVYAYEGNVLLPVTLKVPTDFTGDTLSVNVKADWLICNNICVPESAELSFDLPVKDAPEPSASFAQFAGAASALPEKIEAPLSFKLTSDKIELILPLGVVAGEGTYFFPREQNHILYPDAQLVKDGSLFLPRNVNDDRETETLSGYLVTPEKSYDIRAQKTGMMQSLSASANPQQRSFGVLLLLALMGGLVLNLMPCVLPVLSLKALAIAKKSSHDRKVIVGQALAYTIGVVASFAIISILLITLQQAGAQIGWGFQMQSPPFVGFLTILLFLVGLNLAGMFELPVLFGSALNDNRRHTLRGSLMTGVLATAVATPCTAPFMATAVGATLTLSPLYSFLIFITIGLGLALPFLLIAVFPRLVGYLPKPGAWMETFKQLMSFPMFASVIWLIWVLTQQSGTMGLLVVLITMLALTFIIWLKGRFCGNGSLFCRLTILLLMLGTLINGLSSLSTMSMSAEDKEHFSEAKLAELRAAKTPVFVDATAAWCLTCQVNKGVAINTEKSRAAFKETGTELLIADWTNRDPAITAFLKKFGYNGVPLYVYFPASGEPIVLPQILSESLVISTLKGEKP